MSDNSNYSATNSSNMEWWEYFIPVYNTMRLIETTLGNFGVEMTKDTKTIIDIYDWNKIHLDNASTYGKLRNMMGELGTPDSIPANDKTNIKIQFKRKK